MQPISGVRAFQREMSAEESQAVEDVLDAALEWREGRLPLSEAVKIGAWCTREGQEMTPSMSMARAMWVSDPQDRRRRALAAMLDVLILRQPGHLELTNRGIFTLAELNWAGVTVRDRA